MRKTDKKIDNQLRQVLTDVCEIALKSIAGFQWLTHLVNYSDFPNSLNVVCIFDTNENLDNYLQSNSNQALQLLIQTELQKMNIKFKNIAKHISYDTEANCDEQHDGNWAVRLA
ncbi:Fis family transcriptional regulator [Colwelliaceae bacterium 6471]